MAETVGNVPSLGAALPPTVTPPAPAVIELVQQPPAALLLASLLTATVVGRGGNGALLLRTDYGTLALNTTLALAPGSSVDLRLQPGPPATVVLLNVEDATATTATATTPTAPTTSTTATTTTATAATVDATLDDTPPAQLTLGSDVEATIVAAPTTDAANAALAVGTRLLLRIAVPEGDPMPPTPDGPLPVEFLGTVAAAGGDGQDKTALDTALGRLLLDQRLALPEGTALSLTRLQTIPPSAAAGSLDIGFTVEARVLSSAPSAAESSFPAGTVLTLRVAALSAALAAAGMTGTIVAGASSETVIDTPVGMLALDRRLALPAGTSLALEQLAVTPPDQPGDPPLAQRAGWSALDQALAVLDRAAPELAARLRTDLAPASGQQLAGTLLFLMSALNTGAWPGAKALATLEASGRRDLRDRLDGDVDELRQLAEPKSGDWRLFVLPLLDRSAVTPVKLYMRRRTPGAAPADQGTRFVLDIDMSRLGNVQLDGLVRSERFDLVMRSHRAIAADLRQGIAEVFRNALSAAGLAGDITFATASRFALTPAATIHGHIGVSA